MDFYRSTSSRLITSDTLSNFYFSESSTDDVAPEHYWDELEPTLFFIFSEQLETTKVQVRFEKGKSEMTADNIKKLARASVAEFHSDWFTDELFALYEKACKEVDKSNRKAIRQELFSRYKAIENAVNRLAVECRLKHDEVRMRSLKAELDMYKPGFWILAVLCAFAFFDMVTNH
ncbi:hypothetical protein [Pseudidiomarina insulisalsae]|nr:hypothetical protein [Pseudidiomarina insulisalsae]